MKKEVIIAVLVTFCLTVTLFMVSSSLGYDPWADINDDGKIDMRDIGYEASLFGTNGDPRKNVTVMNWPVSSPVTVWWFEGLPPTNTSDWYNSSGFGHLHLQAIAVNMEDPAEIVKVQVYGRLWNPTSPGSSTALEAYSIELTRESSLISVTIPVPNEEFRFSAYYVGPNNAAVYLCFYLTWA